MQAVAAPVAKRAGKLDLDDPRKRFEATVKMRGSLADGPVHTFVRLHIYGYANEGNLVPFFSMNNYAVNVWKKLPNGNHAVQVFECGVYTAFDSYDVITEWQNPFTNELRKVHQFLLRATERRVRTRGHQGRRRDHGEAAADDDRADRGHGDRDHAVVVQVPVAVPARGIPQGEPLVSC